MKKYKTFAEFYPFYISFHLNPICRFLHVIGTMVAVAWFVYCLKTQQFLLLPLSLVFGYGPAWIGHFVFEKNRPATFEYPVFSFMGDFKMLYEILTFQRKLKD